MMQGCNQPANLRLHLGLPFPNMPPLLSCPETLPTANCQLLMSAWAPIDPEKASRIDLICSDGKKDLESIDSMAVKRSISPLLERHRLNYFGRTWISLPAACVCLISFLRIPKADKPQRCPYLTIFHDRNAFTTF